MAVLPTTRHAFRQPPALPNRRRLRMRKKVYFHPKVSGSLTSAAGTDLKGSGGQRSNSLFSDTATDDEVQRHNSKEANAQEFLNRAIKTMEFACV